MHAFIESIDKKAWRVVLTEQSHPTKTDAERSRVITSEVEWSSEEDLLSTNNWRALNTIFNTVDPNQFKMISTILKQLKKHGILSKLPLRELTHFMNLGWNS